MLSHPKVVAKKRQFLAESGTAPGENQQLLHWHTKAMSIAAITVNQVDVQSSSKQAPHIIALIPWEKRPVTSTKPEEDWTSTFPSKSKHYVPDGLPGECRAVKHGIFKSQTTYSRASPMVCKARVPKAGIISLYRIPTLLKSGESTFVSHKNWEEWKKCKPLFPCMEMSLGEAGL
eukprot:Gb_06479 [translate_table: standard]